MRLGAVDIGTNSCRMLIVDYHSGGCREVKRGLLTTRLGAGVDRTGRLKGEAIERTLGAVKAFLQEMESLGVKEATLAGTSALRDVSNAEDLCRRLKRETGYSVRVLSGREEASLVYTGAGPDISGPFLLIDIGGGSTEFIWQRGEQIIYRSLNLGAVRMTERYLTETGAKLLPEEIMFLKRKIRLILAEEFAGPSELALFHQKKIQAIGSGGTITTLAAIYQGMTVYDRKRIDRFQLSKKMVGELSAIISGLSLEERKELAGLQPERADIIVAGTLILDSILNLLRLEEVMVTEKGILEGLIVEMIEERIEKI